MDAADYCGYDATGLAELVAKGEVTPRELAERAIAGVEAVNPALNAVIEVHHDRLEGLDDLPAGPFRGVPFFLKDLSCREAGRRQECGSRLMQGFVPDADSELMLRFRAAGLVNLGRTTTPEFGASGTTESMLCGATRNPWNTGRSSGGSSGGSAAITAAGVVPMAHASDGGGSIRIPASCCGLVGLKASRGRVSRAPGGSALSSPMAQELVVSRSVRDTARLLDAVHGPAPGEAMEIAPPARAYAEEIGAPAGRLRIGVSSGAWGPHAPEEAVSAGLAATAKLLEDMGHHVEEARPDIDYEDYFETYFDFWCINKPATLEEAARVMGRTVSENWVEPCVLAFYRHGLGYAAADLVRVFERMNRITRGVAAFFADHDALLTPTLAKAPVELGYIDLNHPEIEVRDFMDRLYGVFPYTPLFNLTGQPAISLPLHWSDDGRPVGMQLAAAFGREDLLLRLASALEEARPWWDRRPPVHVTQP